MTIHTRTESLFSVTEIINLMGITPVKLPYYLSESEVEAIRLEYGLANNDEANTKAWELYNDFTQAVKDYKLENSEMLKASVTVRNNNLDSTCSIFERADRIITGSSVSVFLNDNSGVPAYNDGKDIVFNASQIKLLNDENLISLHGLNYHEVGHLLFTPRIGSKLGKWVAEDDKRMNAFNILEDCRQEAYLVAKYSSVRNFLISTVLEHLLNNSNYTLELLGEQFMLLAGRKYLPYELRKASALSFAETYGLDHAKLIYSIVSEYRLLVFPRDFDRARELIEQLVNWLPDNLKMPNGCEHRKVMRNGRAESESSQKELNKQIEQLEQDLLTPAPDSDNKADKESGKESGNSGGELGNPDEKPREFGSSEHLRSEIESLLESAKKSKEVTEKVRDTRKAIQKDSSTKSILGRSPRRIEAVLASDVTTSRRFSQELELIRIDNDPMWEREKPSGKLNVRRAMNADVNDLQKLFDRWENGNDNHEVEAIILLDRSGSMGGQMNDVCRSAWVIKRAIERINGRVSALVFSDYSKTLFTADERADTDKFAYVEASGGTNPTDALLESERIFGQSNKATKLLFVLTDGAWGIWGEPEESIERMKAMGVDVTMMYLATTPYTLASLERELANNPKALETYTHKAHRFEVLRKQSDLVKVAKNVVKEKARRY